MSDEETTIRVKVSTRDELAKLGNKDTTFDDIIMMLIEFYRKKEAKK